MKPQDCKTVEQVCKQKTDNYDYKGYWILADHFSITLTAQIRGKESTQTITIPKAKFDRLIKWYQKDQKERKS